MKVADPEKDKHSTFTNCFLKDLSAACKSPKHPAKATASTKASGTEPHWFQLDFGRPVLVNEFNIKEEPSSSIARYVIECWDDKKAQWVGCFNGIAIGAEFVAPIVTRTTSKARLVVIRTTKDTPALSAFEAYNDPAGDVFNVPKGGATPNRVGK